MNKVYKMLAAMIVIIVIAGYAGYMLFLKPDTLHVITSGDSLIAKKYKRRRPPNEFGRKILSAKSCHLPRLSMIQSIGA